MRLTALAAACLLGLAAPQPATSAPVSGTWTVAFPLDGGGSFEASFALDFDDAADASGDVTLLSGNFATSGAGIGFEYDAAAGMLVIGDLLNGVWGFDFGTTDFFLMIVGPTQPVAEAAVLAYLVAPDYVASAEGTVTFASNAVPEPAALGVFGFGLVGLLAVRRRACLTDRFHRRAIASAA